MISLSDRPWHLTVVTLLLASSANANEPPTLRSNPFARPPSAVTVPNPSGVRGESTTSTLELRATLVGTRIKLANVGGKTVRPGDEIQGHKLLKVFEDRAVFARQGRHVTVFVKPDLEEADE